MRRSVRSHLFPLFTAPRVSGHINQPMPASGRAESETTYKVTKIEGLLSAALVPGGGRGAAYQNRRGVDSSRT